MGMTTATRRAPALPKRPKILEKHVQDGVTALLELDGWRALRTDPVSDRYRGKGFGELGMPDHLYLRYLCSSKQAIVSDQALCELLWIEFKAPSKKARDHQLQWHAAERARGALVIIVDDFDKFRQWYADSGLNRRLIVAVPPAKDKTA